MSKLGSVRVAGGAAGGAGGGGGGGGGGAASPAMPAAPSRNYMLSWETFARIMQTQVLIRSLNATRDAFTEAYEANIKFSKQVSEIHAIDASRNFAQVAANVRQLSDAFNQPLTEVAEAQYQTISNQFVTAAEHANILTAANQLAKVSTQDLGSAAALVTGSLNAYGESSDMAGLRAAQFDQTIALGHLRMNDLATALGRTQTIAHELGVSVEELDASLISLSIGGVKANEAGTQIRGIMSALLKPSENLKTAFHELGVESGEQAISTWGLIGTLGKLNDVTHGSASEMAMLFPNVRGLAGALRIAGEGAEKYNEAMEKLRAVDQSTLQKKYEEFTSTDAEKVTKELNKLKNFYATEFGADIVASMKRVLGGMDSFIAVLRTVTGDLPSLAAAVGTVSAAWLLFGRSATLAATDAEVAGAPVAATTGRVQAAGEAAQVAAGRFSGFKGVLATIGLYEAAKAGGAAIGSWVENRITSEQEGIRAAYEQEREMQKAQTDASVREGERKNKELLQGLRQYVAEANKVYLKHTEDIKTASKVEEQVTKLALDHIMQSRQKMTQELSSISAAASKKAYEDIPHSIDDIQNGLNDRAFNRDLYSRGYSASQQFDALKSRFEALAGEAGYEQSNAKDATQEKRAEAAWKRAEAYRQQAVEMAKLSGDSSDLIAASEMQDELDNRRIRALRSQVELQEELADEAEERSHQAEEHNAELEEMRRAIEGKLKLTTKDETNGGASRPRTK